MKAALQSVTVHQWKVTLEKSKGGIPELCVIGAGLQYSTKSDKWSHQGGADRCDRLDEILRGWRARVVRGVRDIPVWWKGV
jgi:hypothetical protein